MSPKCFLNVNSRPLNHFYQLRPPHRTSSQSIRLSSLNVCHVPVFCCHQALTAGRLTCSSVRDPRHCLPADHLRISGTPWITAWSAALQEVNLSCVSVPYSDTIRYGDGICRPTTERIVGPGSISKSCFILRVVSVQQNLPCLFSRHLTEALGMVLNQVTGTVSFVHLGVKDVPYCITGGGTHWG